MKKLLSILIVGVGVAALPAAARAQSAAASLDATATVLAFLDVQNVADVDFGNINAGSGATLTPGSSPGSGALGILQIDHNSDVSVSASLPSGLTHTTIATAPDLPASFTCGFSTNSSGALDGSAGACTSLANRSGNGDGTLRTSFIQVGGAIAAAATADRIPGTYSGQLVFTVTAVY